jgi:hypothetical protein
MKEKGEEKRVSKYTIPGSTKKKSRKGREKRK